MTVLCTDKTGTLTEGTIVLADATDPRGRTSAAVRQLAFLNASFETGIDNPIDAAIVTAGEQAGLSTTGHAKIDEIPYDFLRKRLTIVMAEGGDAGRHLVVTKGAFSNVLSICTQVERDGADARADGCRSPPSSPRTTRRRERRAFGCSRSRRVPSQPREPTNATTRRRWSSRASCSSSTRPRPTRPVCSATSRG